MLKFNNIRVRIGVIITLILLPFLRVSAQDLSYLDEGELSFKDRIAIRTNVIGWVLTTPNIAFDYDVVNTPYDKRTIGLSLKCNWNTSHSRRLGFNEPDWASHNPNWVYNLFGARFDYRFYWRQQPYDNRDNYYGDWEREWINSAKGLEKLRARMNCFRASEKPKSHISIFAGPYLSVGGFSIKYPEIGRRGFYVGAGATGGIALPLYGYENGAALDLEFGGCVGLQYASFDMISAKTNGRVNSFLPFLTDVRVSFVYRFRSISKQHTEIDYALIDRRYVDRLMELDRDASLVYNDSISMFKGELDRRNQEIALYKQSVESDSMFNKVYSLEYLTPYMYMMEAPKRYTRYNKDTLPKIHIDSIEQIVDPILLSVRDELDSIPHVTSAQIDKEFINQYNNISDADGKMVNRTALIREIYTRLNSYIEDNNSKLVASTFGKDVYSEKLNKYNVKQQGRSLVEIIYKDSVRTVEMTSNDKIEWLNNIKKQAWADAQKRMSNNHPGRVELPEVYDFLAPDPVKEDSVMTDSMMLDSMRLDSMRLDSMMLDSMKLDSLFVGVALSDSLALDSLASDSLLVDSLHQMIRADEVEAKTQKKESRRASKDKSNAKAEKSKKSKKSADKTSQLEELKDSVAALTVAMPDSVIADVVSDTTLQAIRSDKGDKKAKKAAKTKKEKKVEEVEKIEDSASTSEAKVTDAIEAVEADSEKVESEKAVKAKKTAKTKKEKKVEEVEKIEDSASTSEAKVTDAIEAVEVESEKEAKAKKAEKKGKSKNVPEAEEEKVETADAVDQVEESEKVEKTKKAEKDKKPKKSKAEVSVDVEAADNVDVDNSVVETIKENED